MKRLKFIILKTTKQFCFWFEVKSEVYLSHTASINCGIHMDVSNNNRTDGFQISCLSQIFREITECCVLDWAIFNYLNLTKVAQI